MINFVKMHGNGNDFIMVNSLEQDFKPKKALIRRLGDRNLGIGFDQMIHIGLPTKDNKDFYIKFYNADGSQANMCLNGIRCAASYIWDQKFAPNLNLRRLSASLTGQGQNHLRFLLAAFHRIKRKRYQQPLNQQ